MRGVITMNEEYETRFLCNSAKVRGRGAPGSLARRDPGPGRAGGRCGRGPRRSPCPRDGFLGLLTRVRCSKLKWLRLGVGTVKEKLL